MRVQNEVTRMKTEMPLHFITGLYVQLGKMNIKIVMTNLNNNDNNKTDFCGVKLLTL